MESRIDQARKELSRTNLEMQEFFVQNDKEVTLLDVMHAICASDEYNIIRASAAKVNQIFRSRVQTFWTHAVTALKTYNDSNQVLIMSVVSSSEAKPLRTLTTKLEDGELILNSPKLRNRNWRIAYNRSKPHLKEIHNQLINIAEEKAEKTVYNTPYDSLTIVISKDNIKIFNQDDAPWEMPIIQIDISVRGKYTIYFDKKAIGTWNQNKLLKLLDTIKIPIVNCPKWMHNSLSEARLNQLEDERKTHEKHEKSPITRTRKLINQKFNPNFKN